MSPGKLIKTWGRQVSFSSATSPPLFSVRHYVRKTHHVEFFIVILDLKLRYARNFITKRRWRTFNTYMVDMR
ncbi:hypothetical protein L596_003277 [Steinernema carpocapsae]|uniref:Uncharacterized protein n=1 Tax=Steinernema carpocapsae TaxID=34508 RepID=A0A4U8UTM8_STECR|nr:hypothetical protein L596_003277 [Steinernema carpocapsae]